jgi:transposase-like protein
MRPRKYSEEALKMAVNAVLHGGLTLHAAAKTYSVPFTTLQRRVSTKNMDGGFLRPGVKPKLGNEIEQELVGAIQEFKNHGAALTRKEV